MTCTVRTRHCLQMLYALVTIASWLMTTCGIFVFLTLSNTGKPAEYGRYSNPKDDATWQLPARFAWILQESPAFLIPFYFYWTGRHSTRYGEFLTILMLIHYFYRSAVFPFLIRSNRKIPAKIVAAAFFFCYWNGLTQSLWNSKFQPEAEKIYPNFSTAIGIVMFFTGFATHIISDSILISLRHSNPDEYSIPRGFLFEWVSCPNYFGEIVEWIGYAIAARSFPAIAFAFFTICNLAPRAFAHHKWYMERFGDKYPKDRTALVPMVC